MDEFYMRRALRLAQKGGAWVSPNPMVGAVIVKEHRIIAEGYHQIFGGNHAEVNAINHASETIDGSTIYVNLEPCTHYGKTPPCCESIIACKPARVVIGTPDPNPIISGRGIETLKRHGIETTVGVLEESCRRLNERFFKFIQTGTPFVTLKFAQTIDGRIATAVGHSRWISSEKSLRFAHMLRSHHDAVLVGVGTLLQDDPELTVRLIRGRNDLLSPIGGHMYAALLTLEVDADKGGFLPLLCRQKHPVPFAVEQGRGSFLGNACHWTAIGRDPVDPGIGGIRLSPEQVSTPLHKDDPSAVA